jgi:dihydroflavonol-4-reductase
VSYRAVLVTGANGFIARQLIVHLLNKGYNVRGTLRTLDRASDLKQILAPLAPVRNLSFCAAALMRDDGWEGAMKDIDAVFHLASPSPYDTGDRADLVKPAVEGSLRVLKAARDAGITRVVVTSSIAAVAYGHGSGDRVSPFSESDWTNLKSHAIGAFHESKTRAELAVWDFAMQNPEMQITTINPGAVFGPLIGSDVSTTPAVIKELMNGEITGLPQVGFEGVDVRDVADLHERCLRNDLSIGNRYLATAGFIWLRDVVELLRRDFAAHATRITTRHIPDFAVRLAALFDRKASLAVPELNLYTPCSMARACSDLGWHPRPAVEAIRETARSLIAAGVLTPEPELA